MDASIKWINVNKHSILNDRVLLQNFSNHYTKLFKTILDIGCKPCIDDAYNRIINYKPKTMGKDIGYKLKEKYAGTMWKGRPIRNGDLTVELAEELLNRHPAGHNLFDVIPKDKTKHLKDGDLSLGQLRERHPKIKAVSKKLFLKAISEAEEEE